MLKRLDPALFTKYLWEGGSVTQIFGWPHRRDSLIKNKDVLFMHAMGYCASESLYYKPKIGEYAVMFEYNDNIWWNHFRRNEFYSIFMEDN